MSLQDQVSDRAAEEEVVMRLKKDLKRTKALLKDSQLMLDKAKSENTSKSLIRQLKNQVRI